MGVNENCVKVVKNAIIFARTSRRQIKSFSVQQFFKNAAEVWASSPHLRSKLDFAICFPCCNCIFWSCPIQTKLHHENQGCKFEQGNGAIAARWQAKAGVEPPFAGRWRPFSLREVLLGIPPESGSARLGHIPSLPWESQLPLKPCLSLQPSDFEGNCDSFDPLLDFCCNLSCSLICFANVGCSPTPRQHFWKIAGSKNFLVACGLVFAATTF